MYIPVCRSFVKINKVRWRLEYDFKERSLDTLFDRTI